MAASTSGVRWNSSRATGSGSPSRTTGHLRRPSAAGPDRRGRGRSLPWPRRRHVPGCSCLPFGDRWRRRQGWRTSLPPTCSPAGEDQLHQRVLTLTLSPPTPPHQVLGERRVGDHLDPAVVGAQRGRRRAGFGGEQRQRERDQPGMRVPPPVEREARRKMSHLVRRAYIGTIPNPANVERERGSDPTVRW